MSAAWWYGGGADGDRAAGRQGRRQPETRARESPSVSPLADRKIFSQSAIERLIGHEQVVIHPRAARPVAQLTHVRRDFLAIVVARVLGRDLHLFARFEVNEHGRLAEIRPDFLRIENVK